MRRALLLALFSLVASPALAQTGTTVGTLALSATFDNLSVVAPFTGDTDADNCAANACTIQYRVNGSGTWIAAYPPIIDRRATVTGGANPYVKQIRGSVVNLVAGTTYEVMVTYVDPDGVTGGPTVSGTVSTLATAPVRSGGEFYLDDVGSNGSGTSGSPFNTIALAMSATACGDLIHVRPGTYAAATISKTCSASTWYVFEGDSNVTSIVSEGAGTTPNLTISGNYIQIKNLRMGGSSNTTISVTGHHVWIDETIITDPSNTETNNQCNSSHYGDAGIYIQSGAYHVYITDSEIYAPHLDSITPCSSAEWDSSGAGIAVDAANVIGTIIVKDTIIDGGFRDCIGGSEGLGQGVRQNSDFIRLTILNCKDDAIQIEGDNVNLRVAWNDSTVGEGWSAFAMAPNVIGPAYVYRNILKTSSSLGALCGKLGDDGFSFYFHNSCYGTVAGGDAWSGATANQVFYNNITRAVSSSFYYMPYANPPANHYDYNQYQRTDGGDVFSGATNYATVVAFRAATAHEDNGQEGNPSFLSTTLLTIGTGSPAYNQGVTLVNFNDANSDCVALSTAPDMGAFEVGGCAPAGGDVTNPTATITAPTSSATYATGTDPLTTLAGTSSDDVLVSSVTWVNDRGGSGTATGTTTWSVASITLLSGANVITVTATDSSMLTGTDVLTVTYTPPSGNKTQVPFIRRD